MINSCHIRITVSITFIIFSFGCSDYSNPHNLTGTNPGLNNTTRGKELFDQRCIGCHGTNGNLRGGINAQDLQVSLIDSMSIITTIKNGKGHMPPFGNSFADSDLAKIEQYVMTLRKK